MSRGDELLLVRITQGMIKINYCLLSSPALTSITLFIQSFGNHTTRLRIHGINKNQECNDYVCLCVHYVHLCMIDSIPWVKTAVKRMRREKSEYDGNW